MSGDLYTPEYPWKTIPKDWLGGHSKTMDDVSLVSPIWQK